MCLCWRTLDSHAEDTTSAVLLPTGRERGPTGRRSSCSRGSLANSHCPVCLGSHSSGRWDGIPKRKGRIRSHSLGCRGKSNDRDLPARGVHPTLGTAAGALLGSLVLNTSRKTINGSFPALWGSNSTSQTPLPGLKFPEGTALEGSGAGSSG